MLYAVKKTAPLSVREHQLFFEDQEGTISIKTVFEKKTEDSEYHSTCLIQIT